MQSTKNGFVNHTMSRLTGNIKRAEPHIVAHWVSAAWKSIDAAMIVVLGFYDTFKHLRSSASLLTKREKANKFCSEALISA